jgi:hypothetical protein
VALPTRSPTWIVFERDDLVSEGGSSLRRQLAADPRYADAELRAVVDRLTRARTFVPLELAPTASGRETFMAIALFGP